MAEINEIIKLAVDAYRGSVEKYSVGQSQKVLREALIEANNGSTKLDYKSIRDGKCKGLFTLIKTILSKSVVEGLTIVAGDDKPIKFVYEGDSIVLMGDPMQNADFTQEYLYGEKYGLGMFLTLLSILQYLINYPKCLVKVVKREVFRAISICKKIGARYAGERGT